MRPFRNRKIYPYAFPIDFNTVALFFSNLSILGAFKIDKRETSGAPSLCINNDLDTFNWSILGENMIEFFFGSVNAQSKHTYATRGFGVVTGSKVAPAAGHRAV